jgi:EAL domain-containing protein (putative c-di-GMP-specific phosphodiesterase class I)
MITQLHLLRDMGVSIAIDDFGAGYSSFRYLAGLPIDTVKIDQKFLIGVPENQRHCEVIDGIMALCNRLKLSVVTEGVETAGQLEFIRAHEAQLIQGFFIGEPHPLSYYLQLITIASSTDNLSSSSTA